MKISGFTFVKNAKEFGLPVVESIKSLLPLVDEYIVNVGQPDLDKTENLIRSIRNKKIKIIRSEWNSNYTEKMRLFAVQTNIAMYNCSGDWLFYLQADEVIHENDYTKILNAIREVNKDKRIEGLLFRFFHFWANGNFILDSFVHYQREVRVIRNFLGISSYKDAQGFRVDGHKLHVKNSGASIYHYGYTLNPEQAEKKARYNSYLYRKDKNYKEIPDAKNFYYKVNPYFIRPFKGTHPQVMKKRLSYMFNDFNPKLCKSPISFKQFKRNIQTFIYRITGIKIGEYRNFILIR